MPTIWFSVQGNTCRWQQSLKHLSPSGLPTRFFTFLLQIFVSLVFLDDLHGSLGVVEWKQNLI